MTNIEQNVIINTKNVYQLISDVTAKMAKVGISKDNKNSQQGYNFRGIDDVYNVLGSMLAESGLVIIPRLTKESVIERATRDGKGVLIYTKVQMKYIMVSSHDGSKTYAVVSGEAMDSGDKSTNKAMSAAYKYMAFQTFAIPTEGDNDADSTTHTVAPVRGGTTSTDLAEDWSLKDRQKTVKDVLDRLNTLTKEKEKEAKTYTNKIIKNLKFVGSNDLAHELEVALELALMDINPPQHFEDDEIGF